MISTKSFLHTVDGIPKTWIFEHYCKLAEKLSGQDVNIKSLFNPNDKKPSMYIYYDISACQYLFKDFSSGKGGNAIRLVQELLSVETGLLPTFPEVFDHITQEYNRYLLNDGDYSIGQFRARSKYKVTSNVPRMWNNLDAYHWQQFYIGSDRLDKYYVRPLDGYKLQKEEDGELKELYISGQYIYGYFRTDGSLYKIYQPKVATNKFIKVRDYIQGTDQLTYTKPYLGILSSLKDGMSFDGLKFTGIEFVAPDSENTLIRKETINMYKSKYKKVFVLMDNDEAGRIASCKYSETHGLDIASLPLSKDVAQSVKDHKPRVVKDVLLEQFTFLDRTLL